MTLLCGLLLVAAPSEAEVLEAAARDVLGAVATEEDRRVYALLAGRAAPRIEGRGAGAGARSDARARAASRLLDLARARGAAGDEEGFERNLTRALTLFPEAPAPEGTVWFEPYLLWVRAETAERLARGEERVDGAWVSRERVARLDAAHASWDSPWIASDGRHEVRTTLPLRVARSVLAHAGAFRAFLLAELAGAWELRAPEGPLRVLVTATQAELQAKIRAHAPDGAVPDVPGAAFYLWDSRRAGPCVVTFEPRDAAGGSTRVEFPQLAYSLRHELAHQIAFEYSRHAARGGGPIRHQFWAVEGFAEFFAHYVPEARGFRLRHPRRIPSPAGFYEGGFAHCAKHLADLPPLAELLATPRARFPTPRNYHMAATAAYFFLHGDGGRRRDGFLRLLAAVHRMEDRPDTFRRCFPDARDGELQAAWEAFVRGLPLEE
jgi:hypothetical protein